MIIIDQLRTMCYNLANNMLLLLLLLLLLEVGVLSDNDDVAVWCSIKRQHFTWNYNYMFHCPIILCFLINGIKTTQRNCCDCRVQSEPFKYNLKFKYLPITTYRFFLPSQKKTMKLGIWVYLIKEEYNHITS